MFYEQDDAKKKELMEKFMTERFAVVVKNFDKYLADNGGQYLVGNQVLKK